MSERLPPICTADQIKGSYHVGLRIVWDDDGERAVWDIVAVDETTATTKFTAADGTETERSATFEALSNHSAFPIGTAMAAEEFTTPAGTFAGTHVTVAQPDGDHHFYFSDAHPGPPMIISSPGSLNQQVERNDL